MAVNYRLPGLKISEALTLKSVIFLPIEFVHGLMVDASVLHDELLLLTRFTDTGNKPGLFLWI